MEKLKSFSTLAAYLQALGETLTTFNNCCCNTDPGTIKLNDQSE